MRIFYAFLIILVATILFLLPVDDAIYDFRTTDRTDTFTTLTPVGVTSANETLLVALYDGDIVSVDIASDDATDAPLPVTYNTTNRVLNISGLTANATRTLDITYDVDSLGGTGAIDTFVDRLPWVWLLVTIAFGPAALFAIFTGR